MEWVYITVVVGLVILGIVYRDRLKSWTFKVNAKANELSGEFTGETEARPDAKRAQPSSSSPTSNSRNISVSRNTLDGNTSLNLAGSELTFDGNETKHVSDIVIQGEGIDVLDNQMIGEKTRLDLRSVGSERVSQSTGEVGQNDAFPLGEARLQEQAALLPASAPMMETETVIHPELKQPE
jgi:hypothetical protein